MDDDGVTRVDHGFSQELASVDFAPPATPMFAAPVSDASALVVVELPVGWQGGWHPSPKEQWLICLHRDAAEKLAPADALASAWSDLDVRGNPRM